MRGGKACGDRHAELIAAVFCSGFSPLFLGPVFFRSFFLL
jgi:hypothetical protein